MRADLAGESRPQWWHCCPNMRQELGESTRRSGCRQAYSTSEESLAPALAPLYSGYPQDMSTLSVTIPRLLTLSIFRITFGMGAAYRDGLSASAAILLRSLHPPRVTRNATIQAYSTGDPAQQRTPPRETADRSAPSAAVAHSALYGTVHRNGFLGVRATDALVV